MRTYAVMLDPTMIQNILKTDTHEARELMSWAMVGSVLLWSAVPVAFIWWVRIEHGPWLRSVLIRAGAMAGALVIAALSILLVSRDFTSLMRNQREIRYLITPGNYIYGLVRSAAHGAKDATHRASRSAPMRAMIRVAMAPQKPRVFVLVVGETVRAANFSLMGSYARPRRPSSPHSTSSRSAT
jgi:lipid A ethanolaminephosphotransferase